MSAAATAADRDASVAPRHRLDPLLEPQSIAFVGASERPDTPGSTMILSAAADGYKGRLYPVNPNRTSVHGLTCHPDLANLPERVDHVVIGTADTKVEVALRAAIDHGARAATIFSGCDLSDSGDAHLLDRLADMAAEAGIAICGPNSMGFLNPRIGLRVCGFPSSVPLMPGSAALVTQSGSVFSALAFNDQRLKYSLCVASGREITVGSEAYLDWLLDRPEVRVIGVFLEASRRPEEFIAALEKADRKGIPIIALKVGRTALSARFAASHSGAITGDTAVYEAIFRSHGVITVDTIDQLAANLLLLSTAPVAPAGGLVALHDSGGEREMVVDIAHREKVPLATIGGATKDKMRPHLDSGLQPDNPLDVWGSGRDFETHVEACLDALLEDPASAAGVLFQDIRSSSYIAKGFTNAVVRSAAKTAKPVAVVTNYASVNHRALALAVTEAGVPVLDGTEEGLRAIGAMFKHRDRLARSVTVPDPVAPDVVRHWRTRLATGDALDELEALSLLADYGIAVPAMMPARTLDAALARANEIGFPVALKTANGTQHKSDAGGVRLGLADAFSLYAAYVDMARRLGPNVTISRMAPKGIEFAFGIVSDPQFGPFVMIAAGGIWIEVLNDRAVSLAPVSLEEASAMVAQLHVSRLLGGGRGMPPADRTALVKAFSRFCMLASDLGDLIDEMDVNPLLVGPHGCVAVDALLVPHRISSSDQSKEKTQ